MMMISFSTHVDFERVQKIFKSVRIIHTLRLPTHTYEPANENTYFKVIKIILRVLKTTNANCQVPSAQFSAY